MNEQPNEPRMDRRVRRTRDRLGDALVELMQEVPFDELTVQDVLDRAGVSRSTFYTHFQGKDDLLLSDADEFFALMAGHLTRAGDASERVAPVRELFEHVSDVQGFIDALRESHRYDVLMKLGRGHFARGIEERLGTLPRSRGLETGQRRLLAEALAGALVALLEEWLARGRPEAPAVVDALFHRLAWSGVAGYLPSSASTTP